MTPAQFTAEAKALTEKHQDPVVIDELGKKLMARVLLAKGYGEGLEVLVEAVNGEGKETA